MGVHTIQKYGSQLRLIYDDGSVELAMPTSVDLWTVGAYATGPGPTPPPTPATDKFSQPFSFDHVSSEFGPRIGPIGHFHEGIDFSGGKAVRGAKIFASKDGTVELVNINSNYGYSVQIYHGVDSNNMGLHTINAHFQSSPLVGRGDHVSKGQLLGYLGSSGDAQGPHDHHETHTCPNNGPVRHNTSNTTDSLSVRTAINPRNFYATYGDGAVLNA